MMRFDRCMLPQVLSRKYKLEKEAEMVRRHLLINFEAIIGRCAELCSLACCAASAAGLPSGRG